MIHGGSVTSSDVRADIEHHLDIICISRLGKPDYYMTRSRGISSLLLTLIVPFKPASIDHCLLKYKRWSSIYSLVRPEDLVLRSSSTLFASHLVRLFAEYRSLVHTDYPCTN